MVFLDNVTRGGQTWAHRMRMLRQVIRLMILGSIGAGLLFFGLKMHKEKGENFQAAYYYMRATLPLASDKIQVDSKFWCAVSRQCYQSEKVAVKRQTLIEICRVRALLLLDRGKANLKESGYVSIAAFVFFLLFFAVRGLLTRQKKHLQGVRFERPWKVRLKMACLLKKSDMKIGAVPLIKNSETKHMLICGTTGAGKTNALRQLMIQIRRRGDRAIIVDTTGDFVSKFFREEKDILLNPYDARSEQWHPWCECDKDYDYEYLVNSLIPKNNHHQDDFFPEAGRAVILASLMKYKKEGNTNLEELVQDLLRKSIYEIYEDLKQTDARIYVDPQGEKTTVSIRATIANCIRHFSLLKNTSSPFSIRDWILSKQKTDEWLFLACQTGQRKALNSLMTVWFSIALNAIKQRSPNQSNKKIWLIIDELHALQKLEYLEESLAELRKYGGAIVLATQNIAQLDKLYGHHGARIILDQCGTKVSFRQSDSEIAKRMSSLFGEHEFRETQEGLSYGAHEMRDGVNLSNIERTRPTISPTQIMNLPDLEAFIKLPGNWPAIRSRFKYLKQKSITDSYIEAEESIPLLQD
ncbi:MAG: type IV secretion system DNA-binding domain-containing protein [Simkania sp.]|nr:type IV secretion system DNA-binding domain-containing protein [Simkania sp.]